jgi:hypothetical protein
MGTVIVIDDVTDYPTLELRALAFAGVRIVCANEDMARELKAAWIEHWPECAALIEAASREPAQARTYRHEDVEVNINGQRIKYDSPDPVSHSPEPNRAQRRAMDSKRKGAPSKRGPKARHAHISKR